MALSSHNKKKNQIEMHRQSNSPQFPAAKPFNLNFTNTRKCDDCGDMKPRSSGSWLSNKWYCFDCAS